MDNKPAERVLNEISGVLTVENKLLHNGSRPYIPRNMLNVVIERAHDTHNGAQATKKMVNLLPGAVELVIMSKIPDQNVHNTDKKIISWSMSGQAHEKKERLHVNWT